MPRRLDDNTPQLGQKLEEEMLGGLERGVGRRVMRWVTARRVMRWVTARLLRPSDGLGCALLVRAAPPEQYNRARHVVHKADQP